MQFQQGKITCIVCDCAMEKSCASPSWYVLYFTVLCTHLSWYDCRRHAVGKSCACHDVLFTLTMLLQHILKKLGLSWYKFTLTMLSQHVSEKLGLSCHKFTLAMLPQQRLEKLQFSWFRFTLHTGNEQLFHQVEIARYGKFNSG